MKSKMAFVGLMLLIAYSISAQDCQNPEGTWVNELGSALIIEKISDEGEIIGRYASSTGVDGKVFPLIGFVNVNAEYPDEVNISWSVRWKGYGSITSWTGYCIDDERQPKIKTIWNLVRSGKEYDWERIITNSSVFVKE